MKRGTDFHSYFRALPAEQQEAWDKASETVWRHVGQTVCTQGEASDCVYILDQGIVEVRVESPESRLGIPVAYLSRGDIIGELGVLNEKPRSASLVVVVDAVFRQVKARKFLDLVKSQPGFGYFLTLRLAERLANTTTNLAYNSYCVDLSGKLPQFDILAVFQTIMHSPVKGDLKIIDATKEQIGHFFFNEGLLRCARFRHLHGIEAAWQIFLEPQIEGAFTFRRADLPDVPITADFELCLTANDLLLKAAMKRDLCSRIDTRWRNLEGQIRRNGAQLHWPEPERSDLAERVWNVLENHPLALRTVWLRANVNLLTLAEIMEMLLASGQVAWQAEQETASA
jgi:CRP-like cAMP-binding protein